MSETETNIRSFLPMDKIGEGSFASVYKVKRICDGQIYALKKIRINHLPPKARENSLNEVRLLASLSSPYITSYHEAFFDQKIDCLCIVMELASQGDLRKQVNSLKNQKKMMTEIQIWKLLIHLLHGLKVLHSNDILHRDLKCENILIQGNVYKIGDMNVSKINKCGMVETQTGTPYYASPEVWKDEPYNQKSDIWSLGCILYEMTTFRPPFSGTNFSDLHKNIMRGTFNPIPKIYSNQLAQIIYSCLKLSPAERPSVSDLLSNWSLKMYQNICIDYKVTEAKTNVEMLKTIALPKDLKELNRQLPKPNYHTCNNDHKLDSKIAEVVQRKKVASVVQKKRVEVTEQKKIELPEKKEDVAEKKEVDIPAEVETSRQRAKTEVKQTIQPKQQTYEMEKVDSYRPLFEQPPEQPSRQVKTEIQQNQIAQQSKVNIIETSYKVYANNITQNSVSSKGVLQNELELPEKIVAKKICSLQQIDEKPDKNPEYDYLPPKRDAASIKSLEEIQSFNRLIQRIKSTSKIQSQKVQKVQHKKSRRTLKDIDNKVHIDPIKRHNSRSLKRTERSISMSRDKSAETSQRKDRKKQRQPIQLSKNASGSKLNYKICCYSERKGSKNQNLQSKLVQKYQLAAPVSNKYTKILEEAKHYLKNSTSKQKKLF